MFPSIDFRITDGCSLSCWIEIARIFFFSVLFRWRYYSSVKASETRLDRTKNTCYNRIVFSEGGLPTEGKTLYITCIFFNIYMYIFIYIYIYLYIKYVFFFNIYIILRARGNWVIRAEKSTRVKKKIALDKYLYLH